MKFLLYLAAFVCLPTITFAQIKAITETGQSVVLFENGTWQYEKSDTPTTVSTPLTPKKRINDTIMATSGNVQLFNDVSKRLAHFFGEEKSKIKCTTQCTNNKGKVSLSFEFLVPVGDANRYFGNSLQERTITLQLGDGKMITTTISENSTQKFIDKWNISYYKGSCVLSSDHIESLLHQPVIRMTVNWKKRVEEYQISTSDVLQKVLTEVL